MPGILYKFENQNIQTFFDNVKFMVDVPLIPPVAKKFTNFTMMLHSIQSPIH